MAKWNVERGTSLDRVPLLITFVILIHRGSLDQDLGGQYSASITTGQAQK